MLLFFVLLYGAWKGGIAALERLHVNTNSARQYLTYPTNNSAKDEQMSMAYGRSSMVGGEHTAFGWYVLPEDIEQVHPAELSEANNTERLEEGVMASIEGHQCLIHDLRICRDILDGILERTNGTFLPVHARGDLRFCQGTFKKYAAQEADDIYRPSRMRRSVAADREAFPPETPFDTRKETARTKLQKATRLCEETICSAPDIETTCSSNSLGLKKGVKAMCSMCYPYKDYVLIRAHCRRRQYHEARAFYVLCAVMIAAMTAAVALVCIRDVRRKAKNSQLDSIDKSPPRQSRGPRPHKRIGGFRGNIWLLRVPFLKRRQNMGKRPHRSQNDMNSSTKDSTLQQKWERLGIFSKGGRKRVQDVFDLESLSTKDTQSTVTQVIERVPVLPRARRTSSRFPLTEIDSGPSLRSFYGENLPPNDHFATIHTTRPSEKGATEDV
ncbi:hypothetical protein PMAA_043250 [Paecilomyces variotii No. 5]|uniref:Uncharacterized protein n=1 Tax=Byssochlamys spectabilis (strain No. 5 / NBRC 109023) TaxID=1356009 RepID=V5FZC8_BYSSN|nr:hypothetical protein PMAA_043250 [Paecilomyces variotii No. 5]